MAALARGLNEAMRDLPDTVTDIHVFADNKAALTLILAAGQGPSQMTLVSACKSIRPWLTQPGKNHCVHLWWCPGHRGVPGNVIVDKEAGLGTAQASDTISFAYACQCITAQTYVAWQGDMADLDYRSHNNMIGSDEFGKCKHTSANWFLKTAGQNNTHFARLARFVSGHFPHGYFCERFKLEGNRKCWCGRSDIETRDHIWFDCDLWIRKHKPPDRAAEPAGGRHGPLDFHAPTLPGMSAGEHAAQEWRDTLPSMELVLDFLQLNPAVGTFSWLDLVEEALDDKERGEPNSLAILKVLLHTDVRKRAYAQWLARNLNAPLTEFNRKYAAAAVGWVAEHFELSTADVAQLQCEFGLPSTKAEGNRYGVPAAPT